MNKKILKTVTIITGIITGFYFTKIIKTDIAEKILFLIIITSIYTIHNKTKKIYNKALQDLAGITATHTVFNVKIPGTKNIIDMVTIHPTGIYLIKYIKYEGHIRGTLMMDNWEIDTPNGKTHKIRNPVKEMKENESIAKTMLSEKIYPIIIFKNKTICYVLDGWLNENLMMIKEYEAEKIFKDKEYTISYIRREDIFKNMKQFQSKKRK